MGHFKTFLLGGPAAYGLYYITRKGDDGTSILDELLDNLSYFMDKIKEHVRREAAKTIKEIVI